MLQQCFVDFSRDCFWALEQGVVIFLLQTEYEYLGEFDVLMHVPPYYHYYYILLCSIVPM
jgi:hypothetical protein